MDKSAVIPFLRGKQMCIPQPAKLFPNWPHKRNPNYLDAIAQVDAILNSSALGITKYKLLAGNFALFGALTWPDAPLDELCMLICFVTWLFAVDDEWDQPDGEVGNDLRRAEEYRNLTLQFIQQSLQLAPQMLQQNDMPPSVFLFGRVGLALSARYDRKQRERLFAEIKSFILATSGEQEARLGGMTWSLEEYWQSRLRTSASNVMAAFGEYSIVASLPLALMESAGMRKIWHEMNMIISILNDIFSCRKELDAGCLENFVPLACITGTPLSKVVDEAIAEIKLRIARFDSTAHVLLTEYGTFAPGQIWEAARVKANLKKLLDVYRSNCVGTTQWR